jgi:hypothetical protein
MKYFLLIGGFSGFLIAFAAGLAAENDLSVVLRNAMVGCMCGAFLLRGFRMLLMHQIRQSTPAAEPEAPLEEAEAAAVAPQQ